MRYQERRDTLLDSLGERMRENVTTRGVDLLGLSTGAMLHLGNEAVVEVTGLRNPCVQLDRFQPGLLGAVLRRDPGGASSGWRG